MATKNIAKAVTAAGLAAAAGYFLYASPEADKNRRKLKAWWKTNARDFKKIDKTELAQVITILKKDWDVFKTPVKTSKRKTK